MIVVEKRLNEIFEQIPDVNGLKPIYTFGLNQIHDFLNEKKQPYPLIFQPRMNGKQRTFAKEVDVTLDFILAVNTQSSAWNEERWISTYPTLDELASRIEEGFNKSRTVNWNGDIDFDKHPKHTEGEGHRTIELLDVFKTTISLTINDNCQNIIKWQSLSN